MGADARITASIENPLCGRLQQKFNGRGISNINANSNRSAADVRSRGRSENASQSAVRRVADPFEATAEFVPAKARTAKEAYKTRSFSMADVRANAGRTAEAADRRVKAFEKTTPFSSGAYAAAYSRAAEIRARAYDGTEAKASAVKIAAQNEKSKTAHAFSIANIKSIARGRTDEVKVEGTRVSKGLVISIVLFAVVVMMIIFSFSQINEFKKEINGLSEQKAELQTEVDKLSVDIDLKNDVRVIEKAATEDIGMVKSNQVESKYISVSEGERVELVDDSEKGNGEDWGIFTTMMSAVSGNWDKLLEYIG